MGYRDGSVGKKAMKVVILVGGRGTRIGEETVLRPKTMIEIGGRPILWHIMKWYVSFGYNEFIICCGYKGQVIKEYFVNYPTMVADVEYNVGRSQYKVLSEITESWRVTLANTGLNTLTAGRILQIRDYIGDNKEFMLTYGDGCRTLILTGFLRHIISMVLSPRLPQHNPLEGLEQLILMMTAGSQDSGKNPEMIQYG